MNSYRFLAQTLECDSIKLCNQIIEKILDEMDRVFNIRAELVHLNANPSTFMRLILVDPSYVQLRPMLISLLNKYNANYYSLLWNYVNSIVIAPSIMVKEIVNQLNRNNIWDYLAYDGQIFTGSTARGDLQLMNLERWLAINKGVLLKNNNYNNHCHEAVWNFAPYFEDYNATVVRIPTIVGNGSFFHSFLEKDGVVLDFATNAAVINDSFSMVMMPEMIFSCPARELDERYESLCETDSEVPRDMCAVLALAINEFRKGR